MSICPERGADCLLPVQLMPLHPKTPSSLASFKSILVLPFWYRLTHVVVEKRPLNGCSSSSSNLYPMLVVARRAARTVLGRTAAERTRPRHRQQVRVALGVIQPALHGRRRQTGSEQTGSESTGHMASDIASLYAPARICRSDVIVEKPEVNKPNVSRSQTGSELAGRVGRRFVVVGRRGVRRDGDGRDADAAGARRTSRFVCEVRVAHFHRDGDIRGISAGTRHAAVGRASVNRLVRFRVRRSKLLATAWVWRWIVAMWEVVRD